MCDFLAAGSATLGGDTEADINQYASLLNIFMTCWTRLWNTPAFPSSGHSTFSAAGAAALDSHFGNDFSFSDPGDPTENLAPRHFSSFDQAAREAGMSQIDGGIHFMSDTES